MKTGAGKFCASVVLPMPGWPCRTAIGGSFAVVRMICISILQGGACPIAADLELGLERQTEAVGLAGFAGAADENFANLLGDGWPTTDRELVVDPQREIGVAVGAVAKAGTELAVDVDQPALADDSFARGDDAVERLVIGFGRNAPAVEPLEPAVLPVRANETRAQLTQTGRRADEPIERTLTGSL